MGGKNIFLSGTVDLKPENFLPALLFSGRMSANMQMYFYW